MTLQIQDVSGRTLRVNVTVPSTTSIPVGSLFKIVHSSSAQSGTNGSVVTVTIQDPTNPLYSFSAVPLAGTTAGLVEIQTTSIPLLVPITPTPGTPAAPTQPIAAPVVPVLIALSQTPEVTAVIAAINSLNTPTAVDNAVAQLAPSTADLAAPLVTFQGTREFQDLWSSRLVSTQCSEVNKYDQTNPNCQVDEPRSGWWVKGFGYQGNQAAQHGFTGYDSSIVGTMVGYDAPININTRAGIGIGYARSSIDQSGSTTNTDFNTYDATAYIGHNNGPWFINGDLSFGWNDYSGTRQISLPGINLTPHASYSGQEYTAFAITGYNFYARNMTITPLASLQYSDINLANYSETGAGDIGLKVNSQSYNFLESGLGAKVSDDFSYQDKIFVPEIHAKWLHELVNPTLTQTSAFSVAGSPYFTTPGMKSPADTLNVGGSVTLLSCSCTAKSWSLEAGYDYYQSGGGYSANQGMLRFTHSF